MMRNKLFTQTLKGVCVAILAITMTACAIENKEQAIQSTILFTNPGTYTATETGRNGDVTLTVEFSESKIESISVESDETPTIGGSAMEQLTATILENQSLNVDIVTGATLSSNAFLSALETTVEEAGGDINALKSSEVATATTEYTTEADVIIIGAGGAGLTAAVQAANDGASVILLEKSNSVGGNTLCASNGINAYDSDVQLASEEYQAADTSFEGMEALHLNELNKVELVDTFISKSAEVINYFTSLGVNFVPEISDDARNSSPNYYLLKDETDGSTAITMINAIVRALDETDVILYKQMEATELVTDEDNNVTGVIATDVNGNEVTFSGKSIIIATGGFGQNQDLVAEVNPSLAGAITDEQAPTTGQGLLMAVEIGAGTQDLDQIQTFPSVIPGSGMFMSFPLWMSGEAMLVNLDGERFVKEQFEVPAEILAQEGSLAYGIFDQDDFNESWNTLIENGFMYKEDSLEALATDLGIDAEGLEASVSKWNEDAANGGIDTVYGRENLADISGTYYGYVVGVGAHYFMGGLTINENAQVLDTEGNVINNLYAAGEVTGGLHGTQRVDGTGLGDSFVFGYLAGEQAAAHALEN